MIKTPDGKYTAIIAQAAPIDLPYRYITGKAIEVIYIITAGKHKGEWLNQYYCFDTKLTSYIILDFAKLGVSLENVCIFNTDDIYNELKKCWGKVVSLSVVTKELGTNCYIEKCIGSDDIKKYSRLWCDDEENLV